MRVDFTFDIAAIEQGGYTLVQNFWQMKNTANKSKIKNLITQEINRKTLTQSPMRRVSVLSGSPGAGGFSGISVSAEHGI